MFVILGLVIGSYFTFKGGGVTQIKYVFAAVEKGTIVTSITGSGQVSVSDQVDVKPKVSGDVIYVGVKNGQEVRAGTLLAQLDSKDAQKAEAKIEKQEKEKKEILEHPTAKKTKKGKETTFEDKESAVKNAMEQRVTKSETPKNERFKGKHEHKE